MTRPRVRRARRREGVGTSGAGPSPDPFDATTCFPKAPSRASIPRRDTFLAAVHLTAAAHQREDPRLSRYFRHRGIVAGAATGAASVVGVFVLRADAPRLFHGLSHRALPLVLLAAFGGLAGLLLLYTRRTRALRATAAAAVASIILGWGVAQFP